MGRRGEGGCAVVATCTSDTHTVALLLLLLLLLLLWLFRSLRAHHSENVLQRARQQRLRLHSRLNNG
jgi:hypothetical protein